MIVQYPPDLSVQPGEEGDECVLKSKITVDDAADKGDYMLKSTVETDYVLKGADVFTQAEIDAGRAGGRGVFFACARARMRFVCMGIVREGAAARARCGGGQAAFLDQGRGVTL